MPFDDPQWEEFRQELISLGHGGDHEWLEIDEIKTILAEAYRKGLDPALIISSRAAASTLEEFTTNLGQLVRETKIRILAIDDEPAFLSLLQLNLEKTGLYEVKTESVALHWKDTLDAFHPQLLILDMIMPGIDGREILHQLHASPATRHLPVIVLTAILQNTDTGAVNNKGVLFLAKPVSMRALTHCIEEHLQAVGLRPSS